ncbi:hypothetical protein TCAL_15741 [Tigriopus californicus]|uniref:Uncharacterized protein n=1 Tax=Tigriopus californicus TaxID=6832 RepID=A0A553P878_TIGCA|nr:hypothetical protein TCAL_15741 [Tigriopus californicus]
MDHVALADKSKRPVLDQTTNGIVDQMEDGSMAKVRVTHEDLRAHAQECRLALTASTPRGAVLEPSQIHAQMLSGLRCLIDEWKSIAKEGANVEELDCLRDTAMQESSEFSAFLRHLLIDQLEVFSHKSSRSCGSAKTSASSQRRAEAKIEFAKRKAQQTTAQELGLLGFKKLALDAQIEEVQQKGDMESLEAEIAAIEQQEGDAEFGLRTRLCPGNNGNHIPREVVESRRNRNQEWTTKPKASIRSVNDEKFVFLSQLYVWLEQWDKNLDGQGTRRQQRELLQEKNQASGPMNQIAADLFEFAGRHYLVVVDRYSGWPFQYLLDSLTTGTGQGSLPLYVRLRGGPTDDVSVLAEAATVRKKATDKQAEDMESVQLAIANYTTIGSGANATPLSSGPVTPSPSYTRVQSITAKVCTTTTSATSAVAETMRIVMPSRSMSTIQLGCVSSTEKFSLSKSCRTPEPRHGHPESLVSTLPRTPSMTKLIAANGTVLRNLGKAGEQNDDVLEEGQAELAPPTREEELDPAEMVNKTVKRIASTNPRLEELIRKEAGRGVLGSSLGNAAGKMKGGLHGPFRLSGQDVRDHGRQVLWLPFHLQTLLYNN